MPLTNSWHVPHPIYQSDRQKIPAIFTHRQETDKIVEKLGSDVIPYPWIRDNPLQQDGLVVFLDKLKTHGHKAAIVIEEEDDVTVVQLKDNLAHKVALDEAVGIAKQGFDSIDEVGRVQLPPLKEASELQLKTYDLKIDFTDKPVVIAIAGEYPGAIEHPLPREELFDFFVHLEKQQKDDLPYYIFIHDDFGLWAVSRYDVYGHHCGDGISLLPVTDLEGLWRAAHNDKRLASQKDQAKYGDIWRRERIQRRQHERNEAPNVYFLKQFTIEEQRDIRSQFAEADPADVEERGHEFAYPGTFEGTIQDLVERWQQDPWQGYDHHFFAVGDEVYGVSSGDLYHESNNLGWFYGTLDPSGTFSAWVNLDIANMGPDELFEDAQILWLRDLKEYSKEHPNGED